MRAGEHRGSSGMATIASTVMVLLVLAGCGAWRPSGSVQIAAAPNPSATASATPDEAGTPVAVLAVVTETSGKVKAERRLKSDEARLRQFFDRAPGRARNGLRITQAKHHLGKVMVPYNVIKLRPHFIDLDRLIEKAGPHTLGASP